MTPAAVGGASSRGCARRVSQPFAVDELSLEVGASIGVARFPDDGVDSHALLRCADIAMYAAKEAQTDYKLYAAEQNQHSVRRLSVLSDIRHALAARRDRRPLPADRRPRRPARVKGAEGLVRWQHPEHGLIPPAAFVQTVEQTGLIGPLTRHVLEHSIAECAAWRRDGRDLSVAVNLSVRNLLDRDLPREIERLLDTYRRARRRAAARDHREHDHDRPRAGAGHRQPPVGPRRAAVGRRLRHRLLLAGQPAPAADRRAEDRPLVRLADAPGRERPDHRPLDDQPRPRPRPADHRRGRRGRADARAPGVARVRPRPRATTSAGRWRPTRSARGWTESPLDAWIAHGFGAVRRGAGRLRRTPSGRPARGVPAGSCSPGPRTRRRPSARPSESAACGSAAPAAPGTRGRRSARR